MSPCNALLKVEDWKVISCTALNGKTVLALVTVDGFLAACSIIQRVNTADAVPMTTSTTQQGRYSVLS